MTAEGVARSPHAGPPRRPGQLRGGPHGMSREQVKENQRERLLAAFSELIGEHGYSDIPIRALIGRAGVSRKTFYELYENKEDCFLAVQDAIADRLLERVRTTAARGKTPQQCLDLAIDALTGFCVEEPAAARAWVVEALAAGPHARARRAALLDELAEALAPAVARLQPDAARPTLVARATIGAVLELAAHSPDRFAGHELARLAKAIVAARDA